MKGEKILNKTNKHRSCLHLEILKKGDQEQIFSNKYTNKYLQLSYDWLRFYL